MAKEKSNKNSNNSNDNNISNTDNTVPATKTNWKFFSSMEKLEELFEKFQNYAIYGAPVSDKFGHGITIAYRMRPQQATIHSEIMECMPNGWITNKSDFHRKKDLIGTECMLNLLLSRDIVSPELVSEYSTILQRMNIIAQQEQEMSLNAEFDDLMFRIGHGDKKDIEKAINELRDVKDKWLDFNRKRKVV